MARFRQTLPRLARALLYPDAVSLRDLPAGRHDLRLDFAFRPPDLPTPDAPDLGTWPRELAIGRTAVYPAPEVFSARLRRVMYWPATNLVLTDRRAPIRDSTVTVLPIDRRAWTERFTRGVHRLPGTWTVFRSVHLLHNYFHTVVHDASRLYMLRQPPYCDLPEINLMMPGPPTPAESFVLDRYLPGNVRVQVFDDGRMLRPDEMILPSFLARRWMPHLPRPFLDDMLPHFLPDRPRRRCNRIFIGRKEGSRRRGARNILNEDALWRALQARGFQRHYLEDLGFEQQIELFYDAEAVVGAHGAGLTNLLYARDVDVVELHAARILIPTYYFFSLTLGHRYAWWCADGDHFDADFAVDVDAVSARLPAHLR
ncbi:MAG: glycosyltransferase family 61 protein [Hyphomicrobiales bacterium]|nr:glycosyltransferase family 61 protein [Hyphomicrobiales bacterium]MCP5374252.1 glycosyltransferase family 61 protein [Hyphomicrobiales bacterium]